VQTSRIGELSQFPGMNESSAHDRWGPLLGPDRAFDPTRFFIFCGNVIGSPYGTVSSVTTNPETGKPYGPEMPGSTPKDDVR